MIILLIKIDKLCEWPFLFFNKVNVISEEDDVEDIDLDTIRNAPDRLPEVDEVIPQDEDVAVDAADLDVWIDPLDATQVPFDCF